MSLVPNRHAQPNVVLVICDDLAWGDLSCHGNPDLQTLHLDALHAQSARLHRHCSGPLCTPARASDTYCGRSMMDRDEITLAQLLKGAGYATGIFGKWHLGMAVNTPVVALFGLVPSSLRVPPGYGHIPLEHNAACQKMEQPLCRYESHCQCLNNTTSAEVGAAARVQWAKVVI